MDTVNKFIELLEIQVNLLDEDYYYKIRNFFVYDFILNNKNEFPCDIFIDINGEVLFKIMMSLNKMEKLKITEQYTRYDKNNEYEQYCIVFEKMKINLYVNRSEKKYFDIQNLYLSDSGLKSSKHNFYELVNKVKNKEITLNVPREVQVNDQFQQEDVYDLMNCQEKHHLYGFKVNNGYKTSNTEHCCICYDNFEEDYKVVFQLKCSHYFCKTCIFKHIYSRTLSNHLKCPLCRTDIEFS